MEMQLAEQLGVSRTPIREAIRKLELEGLVLMIPRRGAIVAKITEKDLKDVLEVLSLIPIFHMLNRHCLLTYLGGISFGRKNQRAVGMLSSGNKTPLPGERSLVM